MIPVKSIERKKKSDGFKLRQGQQLRDKDEGIIISFHLK